MSAPGSWLAVIVAMAAIAVSPGCGRDECAPSAECGHSSAVTPRREVASAPAAVGQMEVEVDYSGCETVMAHGPDEVECIYTAGAELRLWVVHANVDLAEVRVDGEPITAATYVREEEAGGGFRFSLPSGDAERLTVMIGDEPRWSLRLRAKSRLTPEQLQARAEFDEAWTTVEGELLRRNLDVVPLLMQTIYEANARGLVGDAVDLGLAASYHLTWLIERVDLSQAVLEDIRPIAARYPVGEAALSIYLGHTQRRQQRVVDAATSYRKGARFATRVEDDALLIDVLPPFALVLAQLGYDDAAAYWNARSLELPGPELRLSDSSGVLEVVAATKLRLREAGRTRDDPSPYYARLLELLGPGGKAKDPWLLGSVRLGLAELAHLEGDQDAVLTHIHEFRKQRSTLVERATAIDLELQARIAKGTRGPSLWALHAELEEVAGRSVGLESRWRATVREGQLREVEGDLAGAIASYERSEAILDELLPLAALGVGGHTLGARHAEGKRRLIAVLLGASPARPEAALCAARRAEARQGRLALLRPRLWSPEIQSQIRGYLDAKRKYEALLRDDDKRPGDELARARREAMRREQRLQSSAMDILSSSDAGSPSSTSCEDLAPRQPGELLLGIHGLGRELTVLASGDGGVVHRSFELPDSPLDDAALATSLLGPLSAAIDDAERIRVLASGRGASIPVHALPWRDQPLALFRPVVYGLDLPTVDRSGAALRGGVLILSDDEAGGAPDEAQWVKALLEKASRKVEDFDTGTSEAGLVRKQLGRSEHFYYVGHGYYTDSSEARRLRLWPPYPGGAASEPSYLPLDGVSRLEVPDILMMSTAPRTVVLMACASGVTDDRTSRGGVSLAAAFLGAGTRVVVASTRVVESDAAFLLGRGLHHHLGPEAETDPGRWMARGLRWALDNGMRADAVADYRVYVP